MSTRTLVRTALVVLCAAVTGAAPAAQVPAAGSLPTIEFEKITLDNGLEVILSQDDSLPLVAVNLWYHVGPANESEGRTGFAHLFEHMMFQGSKHIPADQHFPLLEAAGATGVNSTTGYDRTNYYETVPSNQLELALWLESDRMGYLLELIDQSALSNQQDVVRNERRLRVENEPYGMADEELFQTIFPAGHPYYGNVIGSHQDIQAAQLEDVRDFFQEYYAPNNASLAIVGDFDRDRTVALVEEYFGTLWRGPDVPAAAAETPPITEERRREVPSRVELPSVYMGWLTAPLYAPGDAEADVAAQILGGGRSSRLYKALVYDQQIAQNVQVFQQSMSLGSVFQVRATARPGYTAADLEQAIDSVLALFLQAPPTPEEMQRAVNAFETGVVGQLEGLGGVANRLNTYNHYLGDPDYLAEDIDRYRVVTPEDVQAFARERLQPSARAVIHAVPGEPALFDDPPASPIAAGQAEASPEGINEAEDWRFEQPAGEPVPSFSVPTPASAVLDNGLTLIVSEERGVPIVSARLVVGTGSDANPLDRPGLASLMAGMLDEGTESRSALEIADELANLGSTLGTTSNMDATTVVGRALTQNFASTLELMADVALRPSFPAQELERQRASRSAQIVQRRETPETRAREVLAAVLYGAGHPYGYTEFGTPESVAAITRDDLVALWRQNFVPRNAALVVAGDISLAELRSLAEDAFGDWDGEAPPRPALGAFETTDARVVIADMPGAAQTQLIVTKVGVPRSTADYEALSVMNTALGGSFSSRINMNLREEHGYTYGAQSVFTFRKGPGPFYVFSPVRTDVTAPALEEIFLELREAVSRPIAGEELQRAKDSLVLSLPGGFQTSAGLAAQYANVHVYGLGLDYFGGYADRITAVDAAAVQIVAERYVTPDEMIVVAAGDRAQIESALADLDLGPLEIFEDR